MRFHVLILILAGLVGAAAPCHAADERPYLSSKTKEFALELYGHLLEVKKTHDRNFGASPEQIPAPDQFYERCVLMRNLMFFLNTDLRQLQSTSGSEEKSISYLKSSLEKWRSIVQRKSLIERLRGLPDGYAWQIALEFERFAVNKPWPIMDDSRIIKGRPSPTGALPRWSGGVPGWSSRESPSYAANIYIDGDIIVFGTPGTPGTKLLPVSLLDSLADYLEIEIEMKPESSAFEQRQDVWNSTLENIGSLKEDQIDAILRNVNREDLNSLIMLAELLESIGGIELPDSAGLETFKSKVAGGRMSGNSLFKQVLQNDDVTFAGRDKAWLSYQLWREKGSFKLQPIKITMLEQEFKYCFYTGHDIIGGKPKFIIGAPDRPEITAEIKLNPKQIDSISAIDLPPPQSSPPD